ncbi:hypothetical protein HK097_007657 [Rhizophlyctis rosea]|uniref:Uncharacterized protein n=1 Tax=Rhizophlyctis rosea TaxID=64517 RepID=A0AAD5SEF2_9FUNG|nr:hypothetical protein HK097_007657 [Rhizophlyctis rosea]
MNARVLYPEMWPGGTPPGAVLGEEEIVRTRQDGQDYGYIEVGLRNDKVVFCGEKGYGWLYLPWEEIRDLKRRGDIERVLRGLDGFIQEKLRWGLYLAGYLDDGVLRREVSAGDVGGLESEQHFGTNRVFDKGDGF